MFNKTTKELEEIARNIANDPETQRQIAEAERLVASISDEEMCDLVQNIADAKQAQDHMIRNTLTPAQLIEFDRLYSIALRQLK